MKLTLDKAVVLGSSSALWPFRSGVAPVIETFDVTPADADALLKERGRPITLKYEGLTKPIEIKNLWVLSAAPAPNPKLSRVRVADRRWLWPYIHILRRYNMRRRVGFFRIETPEVEELQRVEEDLWYARYSVRDPEAGADGKWKSDEVLGDIFSAVLEAEFNIASVPAALNVRSRDIDFAREIPIENLEIDDVAPMAITRALSYFPEIDFFLDGDGDVVLYSRSSGIEAAALALGGPEFVGEGHVEFIERSLERPQAIDVLFTYEIEIRFDFLESDSFLTTETEPDINTTDLRRIQNVLSVPDFSIVIGGETVPQSTYVTFDQYMPAAGVMPGINAQIDHLFLQQAFVPFNDLWAALKLTGERDADRDWGVRVNAFERHYRQTFRLNRRWMDRILSLRPYRIATVNREAGSRAPAEAYADHAVLGSQRSFFKDAAIDGDILYAVNIFGYPQEPEEGGDFPFPFEPNQRPSPAKVVIDDHDQGIVSIEFKGDPIRLYEVTLPSTLENMPSGDLDRDLTEKLRSGLPGNPLEFRGVAFDAIPESLEGLIDVLPKLTGEHKVALILTAIPASPNTVRQLHRVRVLPEEVSDLLPPGMRRGLDDARGPVKEVRIQPAVETARVAWKDSSAVDIEQLFGIDDDTAESPVDPGAPSVFELEKEFSERIKDLVVNRTDDAQGGASLNSIARAVAAREYAKFADHFEGEAAFDMNEQILPGGWLDQVTHEQTPEGVTLTRVSLPATLPEVDWLSLADSGSRAIVMRLALKSAGQ